MRAPFAKYSPFFLLVMGTFLFSCQTDTNPTEPNSDPPDYLAREYPFVDLAYNDRPYSWWVPAAFDDYTTDEKGVIVFEHKDETYYHPVQIAQKILHFLASYNRTGNSRYIEESEKFAAAILKESFRYKEALYFPYRFDWPFGGSDLVLRAPWVSGMAQGQLLSAFVNLYRETDKDEYLETCHEIFHSFYQFDQSPAPWIAYVDSGGYYWIEEYPEKNANHVLNGYLFAIFGLYEYHLLNQDSLSRELFNASLTTIQDHLHLYRVPGGVSSYCIKYPIYYPFYHLVHTDQIKKIYKMTGSDFFLQAYNQFYSDYHE